MEREGGTEKDEEREGRDLNRVQHACFTSLFLYFSVAFVQLLCPVLC